MSDVPTYYSNVNSDLLASIPPDSKRILEVGCGTGALASRFKLINPRAEYWGVEAFADAGRQANSNPDIDNVFTSSIEEFLAEFHDSELRFSTLVFGDVLEHLADPLAVLKQCVELLEPNGSVVACVPNVQNWSVVATLLNGDWPQMDEGLFDRTHLRNFTKKSLIAMFEDAGLTVAKIRPRVFNTDGVRNLVDAAKQFHLVDDAKALEEGLSAYQWIIHGFKGELPKRKVLVRGFTAEGCCARPRLTEPGSFINTVPGFRYSETPTQVEPGESVVVVRQRFKIDEPSVNQHIKDGCLIVGEWDDDPWFEGFASKLKVPVEWALKACHAIQVSTEAIAELVRPINPNVAVFPNQIAVVGPRREYVESDVVRIYMGGQRRREDWCKEVAEINELFANPWGWDMLEFVVIHDRELYDAIDSPNKTFYAFQPYKKYRELLRSCDVAISPLARNKFNKCKSDITFIECSAEGTRLLDEDWWIELIMDAKTGLNESGEQLRSFVIENRMLCDHYRKRHEWYNGLLDDKAELDRQLFERLPELRPTQ